MSAPECRVMVPSLQRREKTAGRGSRHAEEGFTRLELAVTTAMALLLMVLALPAVANKARSQQAGCWNNLRQIGRAYHVWASEHGNYFPYSIIPAQGGTATIPVSWIQFSVLSNNLESPKLLVCPSDEQKRPASEFSTDPARGLFHANFRNSSVSYFLTHPFWKKPGQILAGDRNIQVGSGPIGCSQFGSGVWAILPQTPARWTNNMHVGVGHLLHVDGQVELLDNSNLRPALSIGANDNGSMHLAMP